MSYDDTIQYLYNLQKYGIKFGIENISRVVSELGDPHKSFLSVHVAGTNGKGSTSAIIAAILRAIGLKVGLFTSPHLISFTERIRVDENEISEKEVIDLAGEIRDIVSGIEDFSPTFFEVVTAMALLYFKRKNVDIGVIETGMGGRLDATNIILPAVSVITSISYDHREFLGATLKGIAREKAGIIKNGTPVVISDQESEAREIIRRVAEEGESELYIYGRDFFSELRHQDMTGIRFDYREDSVLVEDIFLTLAGAHQMQNAAVAIKAFMLLAEKMNIPTASYSISEISPAPRGRPADRPSGSDKRDADRSESPPPSPYPFKGEGAIEKLYGRLKETIKLTDAVTSDFIREGLRNVKWPGRLEFINDNPPVLIDAAHNPAAALMLSKVMKDIFYRDYSHIILILGIMGDKDMEGIMEPLLPLASDIILTAPAYVRAASPERLADIAASIGFPNVQKISTVKGALHRALALAEERRNRNGSPPPLPLYPLPLILITGSFYTIGEAKEAIGQKGVLTRLRE